MASFNKEDLGTLHQRLTITVSKDEYTPLVESGLKKVAKSATIKGFRQGMVPVGVVKKMYGNQVLADEISQYTSQQLDKYLQDNNIKFLGHPLGQAVAGQVVDIANEQDYQFVFELGIQPEFELAKMNGNSQLTEYKVRVDEALLEKEIDYELTRYGKSSEVESDMLTDDVINVTIKGENFDKTINLLLKTVKSETAQKQLMSMKPGETIDFDFNAAYEGDHELLIHRIFNIGHDEFDRIDVAKMQVTLNKIFRLEKATLDQTVFDKVFPGKEIATLDSFKEEMRKELELSFGRETNRKAGNDLREAVIHNTTMQLPDEFLRKWIVAVNKEPLTDQQVNEGFHSFIDDLKWTLIRNKVVVENNLQVKEEDLKARVMEYLNQTYKGMDEAMLSGLCERVLENEKEREYMVNQLVDERVISHLRSNATFTNKEVSLEEFEHLMNPHPHHHHH